MLKIMKFLIILSFCLVFIINDSFGQNLSENQLNTTTNAINLFEDFSGDNGFDIDYNITEEVAVSDDISGSDTIPSKVDTKHGLDESIGNFVESGMNFLYETRNVFREELNQSNSVNDATDVWIAYSKSWGRVFEALIKDLTPKLINLDPGDISLDCISVLLEVVNGLKHKKDWAAKCESFLKQKLFTY